MKRPSNLSESLHRQLNAYALAATAAGVSLLALAQPTEGKIVYTKTHVRIFGDGHHSIYQLDLNHDGTSDFEIMRYWNCTSGCWSVLYARPNRYKDNEVEEASPWAYALERGVRVASSNFRADSYYPAIMFERASSGEQQGYWFDVKNRYLGLKFRVHGKYHYGWARMSVSLEGKIAATLTGYAYETIPNKAIITGKTHGKDVITMQDGASLGALAAGANGLHRWRQR